MGSQQADTVTSNVGIILDFAKTPPAPKQPSFDGKRKPCQRRSDLDFNY